MAGESLVSSTMMTEVTSFSMTIASEFEFKKTAIFSAPCGMLVIWMLIMQIIGYLK
jgi:hypothetical protein